MMRILIIQLFLLAAVAAYGQTIDDILGHRNMPPKFLPGFTELQRTDNFLEIRTSAVGTMQIKLLPVRHSSWLPLRRNTMIICVIRTVCGGGCDSHIQFFDRNWQELDATRFLPTISATIFFDSAQKEAGNYKYALFLSGISPISAQFNEGSTDMTLTFNYRQHLPAQTIAELSPFLKTDTVVLQWRNGAFR